MSSEMPKIMRNSCNMAGTRCGVRVCRVVAVSECMTNSTNFKFPLLPGGLSLLPGETLFPLLPGVLRYPGFIPEFSKISPVLPHVTAPPTSRWLVFFCFFSSSSLPVPTLKYEI